jgi:general stress protein 26
MDPYTEEARNNDLTTQVKIDGLKEILTAAHTGMLTTVDKNGQLHSRAMTPCSRT